MQRESIHRYRILNLRVIITASRKVLGSDVKGIDTFLSSSVSSVVVRGTLPPQQWLNVIYEPFLLSD